MDEVTAGPVKRPDPNAETKAKAGLWGAVWEADQFMSFDEIREYVEGTLREIEVDRP